MSEREAIFKDLDVVAWEDWIQSPEGHSCLEGSPTGEYLENRLWRAFMAACKERDGRRGK